jgi:hypothetical protein
MNYVWIVYPGRRTHPAFLSGAIIRRPFRTLNLSLARGFLETELSPAHPEQLASRMLKRTEVRAPWAESWR